MRDLYVLHVNAQNILTGNVSVRMHATILSLERFLKFPKLVLVLIHQKSKVK